MPLIPFVNQSGKFHKNFISIKSRGRLFVSKGIRKKLGGGKNEEIKIYLAYDPVRRCIGIMPAEHAKMENGVPFTLDKDGNCHIIGFIKQFGLPHDKLYRYILIGEEEGWLLFKRI
ncbi:hypothetical protein [Lihuaxuella thermophila]|uniref:Uncharacterized protein n=1 Tax=Lihuaxuella thermophila TaxID=1173111 RepID=A0A1H8DXB2_9BACL|nr:hypothetical protein [Lihuaxuella thermophila]SEN11494.1 hypothetical protein SAMN05444955_1068 [Lihuaxuella thermophila]